MERFWTTISIEINYGYFGDFEKPLKIEAFNDGYLYAPDFHQDHDVEIVDDASLSEKDLQKLDGIVNQLLNVDNVETTMILDGPSFECLVHLKGGLVRGLIYYSSPIDPLIDQLEVDLRAVLQEPFFQKKYRKQLSRW